MKRILIYLLILLEFATIASAQTFHIIPLRGVNIDGTSNWFTKVGGYINTGSNGGNIDLSNSGGYIHTIDSGGSITTSHHGGYIVTNYYGGAIYTGNTGGGIFTQNLGGTINTYNSGGTIDTSNTGASITTSGYTPSNGWGLIYNSVLKSFIPQAIPTSTSSSNTMIAALVSGPFNLLNSVDSKITFTAVQDTGSHWDNTNSRFTPPAGYYQVIVGLIGDPSSAKHITIKKNGSLYKDSNYPSGGLDTTWTELIYMNGTDYIELFGMGMGSTGVLYSGSNVASTYLTLIPLP